MIDLIKKNILEFFNANGLPSKKLENWKFTSSKNFKSFNKSSSSIKNQKIESDELSIVFVNGVLDKNSLKNFKFSDLLEVKNLDELNDKELLRCSENFLKFPLTKIPTNVGKAINKNILTENFNRFKSNSTSLKNEE